MMIFQKREVQTGRLGSQKKNELLQLTTVRTDSQNFYTTNITAYNTLRNRIPNVPADTKLSKIKTLRYATNYIKYLDSILKGEISSSTDFNPTNCV